MKKNGLLMMSALWILSSVMVAQNNTKQDKPVSLPQSGNVKNADKEKEKEFITKAASGGMMEVELGQWASQNATSHEVREFGKMMVKDHTDANTKLKGVIAKMQMSMPQKMEKKHQDMVDKMKKFSGKDFDKEYMDMMVKDHKEDVKEFEKAQDKVSDRELKNWISTTLPVLKMHGEKAEAIKKQLNEKK